jgi:hypothetical protein
LKLILANWLELLAERNVPNGFLCNPQCPLW